MARATCVNSRGAPVTGALYLAPGGREIWKYAGSGTPAVKLPQRAPCQEAAGLLAYDGPREIPVPPAAPRREAKIVQAAAKKADKEAAEKHASVKVAAHHHHGKRGDKDTVNLAARRKAASHGHRKSAGHRFASATP